MKRNLTTPELLTIITVTGLVCGFSEVILLWLGYAIWRVWTDSD